MLTSSYFWWHFFECTIFLFIVQTLIHNVSLRPAHCWLSCIPSWAAWQPERKETKRLQVILPNGGQISLFSVCLKQDRNLGIRKRRFYFMTARIMIRKSLKISQIGSSFMNLSLVHLHSTNMVLTWPLIHSLCRLEAGRQHKHCNKDCIII